MDAYQNLITLDIQVAAMIVSNILGNVSFGYFCPIYLNISYYLTFLQAMFIIKVNTSLDPTQVWWFDTFWCIVLYSYIVSILFGLFEFTVIPHLWVKRKSVVIILKILYLCLFVATTIIVTSICDPDKCKS